MHDILTVTRDFSGFKHYNASSSQSLQSKTWGRVFTYTTKLPSKCRLKRWKIEKSTAKTRYAWHFDTEPGFQWPEALQRRLQSESAIQNLRARGYIQHKAVSLKCRLKRLKIEKSTAKTLHMHDILTVTRDFSGFKHYNASSSQSMQSKTWGRVVTYTTKLSSKCRLQRRKIEKSTAKTRYAWHFVSEPGFQWLEALQRKLDAKSANKNLWACVYIQHKAVLEVSA